MNMTNHVAAKGGHLRGKKMNNIFTTFFHLRFEKKEENKKHSQGADGKCSYFNGLKFNFHRLLNHFRFNTENSHLVLSFF